MKKKKQKSLRLLKAKCWKVISEYVRRLGADEGGTNDCYTCGKLAHWKELHAGHAIPGRHNAVLFDVEILRPQCPVCNLWKDGMGHVFSTKLIKENGMEWWDKKLEGASRIVKYTKGDIEQMIQDYKAKLV